VGVLRRSPHRSGICESALECDQVQPGRQPGAGGDGAHCDDARGPWATLTVSDDGIGIPASDLPHVLERFHRGRNASGQIAGTELGLAGVRRIVELHGGKIELESAEGVGTTVRVWLPVGKLIGVSRTEQADVELPRAG